MRVAAVALVLVVGAAVVLAFANTLNSWVLGGLLGGLAALLLSIPISLSLFTLLARRHDARGRSVEYDETEDEFNLDDEFYNDAMVYEAEGYTLTGDEDFLPQPHHRYLQERQSQSIAGYLPAAQGDRTSYDDDYQEDFFERAEPRNYPRQPRHPARSLAPRNDETASQITQRPTQSGSRRDQSTYSLAQHKSAALRKARQEARQRATGSTNTPRSRRSESRAQSQQRPRTSRHLRPSNPTTTGVRRQLDEQERWAVRQERTWRALDESFGSEDEPFTDQINEQYQHYPRRPSYPRRPRSARSAEPWTGEVGEEYDDEFDDETDYQTRRDPNMLSGSLRNPLVRRAPYLYDDDPLREEFAQQLRNERPITRRSSRYEEYEDDEY